MEAQEIEKIVAALRCTGLSEKCDSCNYGYHLCQDSDCNDACDNERLDKDAAAAIEALQGEVQFYKNLAEEWRETADSKERLLGMYRAQNIYSAQDASGNVITNLCSSNRSESPNSPENPDS